jgi:radical SAM superfamily enzyme YgiQ (UPF0313 family)
MDNTIVLVQFAFNYPDSSVTPNPPSGILYVGDALKKAGYNVKVYHYHSTMVFTQSDIEQIIKDRPLYVGLSMVSGAPVYYSSVFAQMVKDICPEIPIVVGGVHPTLQPNECLEIPCFDICVMGEGEETSVELADVISRGGALKNVMGIGYKESGKIIINQRRPYIEDLDKYGEDWSLVNLNDYLRKDVNGFHIITSRGCPFDCGFCYNLTFNPGRRWRSHTADFVLKEIRWLHEQTGATIFTFNDDNFFVNQKRAFEILEGCKKMGIKADFVEIRIDSITEEIIRRISGLGIQYIFVGWESGSDRTLKEISKGYSRSLILEKFRLINKIAPDLVVSAYAIIGFPFENESDILSTVDTALEIHKIHPNTMIKIQGYYPFPGTPQYELALKHGYIPVKSPDDWLKISQGENYKRPWLSSRITRQIPLIGDYSQVMCVWEGASYWKKLIAGLFSMIAYYRLKFRIFAVPLDIKLRNMLLKTYSSLKRLGK